MQSKESKELYDYLFANKANAVPSATVGEFRFLVETFGNGFAIPDDILIEGFLLEGLPSEWIRTNKSNPEKVILFLHLGGFIAGSKKVSRSLYSQIIKTTGFTGLAIDYRLAPENPFPAALIDSEKAYSWLLGKGYFPKNIIILGESAGGGLAVSTMLSLKTKGIELPAGCVLISPQTDLTYSGESVKKCADIDLFYNPESIEYNAAELYTEVGNLKLPYVSPLFGDLTGLPSLLIQTGTNDILLDDSRRLAQQAKEAKVEVNLKVWEGMWHIWHFFHESIPEAQKAIYDIAFYIKSIVR